MTLTMILMTIFFEDEDEEMPVRKAEAKEEKSAE